MNTIKITVEAYAGEGKSCVAYAIADALRKHNLNCTVDADSAETADALENSWGSRISQVASRATSVKIVAQNNRGAPPNKA